MATGSANARRGPGLTVELADAAARGATFECELAADDLPRLAALAEASAQDAVGGTPVEPGVVATLGFEAHRNPRFVAVTVRARGRCALTCQRCLELVPVDIDVDTVLAVGDGLDDEALDALERSFERWDHEGDVLAVAELLDELIVLELPLVVVHAGRDACGPLAGRLEAAAAAGEDRQTPFAGLKKMLGGERDEDN